MFMIWVYYVYTGNGKRELMEEADRMHRIRKLKRCTAVTLALLLCVLAACAQAETDAGTDAAVEGIAEAADSLDAMPEKERMSLVAGTYRYEGEGFGGDFTITLNADGSYSFYEGPLSSYLGGGTWRMDDGTVHMTEQSGFDLEFLFEVQDDALAYLAAGSDAFPYVKVSDAERFVRQDTTM